MAILKLGDLVTGIRGSVGAVTYSAGMNGAYARGKTRGPKTKNPAQQPYQATIGQLGAWWASLTVAQRAAWDALSASPPEVVYNSLGEVVTLSGWQWFGKVVARRCLFAYPPTLTAPGASAPLPFTSMTAAVSVSGFCGVSSYGGGGVIAGEWALMYMARSLSAGRSVAGGKRLWLGYVAGPTVLALDFTAGVRARFPDLAVGQACTVWVCKQGSTGLRCPELVSTVYATA